VYDEIAALPDVPQPVLQPMDLQGASPLEYQTFAESVERQLGRLDGVVHAAVKCEGLTPLGMLSPEEWISTLHVDLSAPFLLTQACMPLLLVREDSAVVFVLDDPARMARAHWGAYGVAKAGLEGLVSILHEETDETSLRRCARRCAAPCGRAKTRPPSRRPRRPRRRSCICCRPRRARRAGRFWISAVPETARGKPCTRR